MLSKRLAAAVGASFLCVVTALPVFAQKAGDPKPAVAASATPAAAPAPKGAPSAAPSAAASAAPAAAPAPSGAPAVGAAAPPPGPAAAAAPAPAAAPAMDGPTYAVRLRDLEQRIDELKEQIRRSHTRLSLLSDTILSGGGAGSRGTIKFSNELSSAFKVTRLLIVLDGAVQYNKTDQSGALSEQAEIPIFNGSIPPGDHTVQLLMNLQGNGYGVFSYLRGYRFEVKSSHSFTAVEGKTVTVQAVGYEKGGVTTPLEERPAIRYVEKVQAGLADSGPVPAAPAVPAAAPAAAPK